MSRQARLAAEAAAYQKAVRRRTIALSCSAGVLAIAIVVVIVIAAGRGGGGKTKVATGPATTATPTTAPASTAAAGTTTSTPLPSAEGKPCVAVSDPLPTGAPPVPVKVGPPPSQLVTEDLKVGTGATVVATDTLTVNYIGVSCSTGKIFDSSYSRNQPATFPLSNVIPGWQAGIPGMKVGGQRLLGIPPAQAYGAAGSAPAIAPGETLWFVVEVVSARALGG